MIVWGRGGGYFPRRNHMGLRWFHTSEVWRMGQRLCAYSRISSTLAMLYDVSSGVSESDMLLKCEPRITQSPLSIASLMRFFICVLVSQPRESDSNDSRFRLCQSLSELWLIRL